MENTINLHAFLTKYFNDSKENHTRKFVRVTFTNINSHVIILLDTNMYLWYIFEGKKNQYPSIVSTNVIQMAESIWTNLQPVGEIKINKSRIIPLWNNGCSRYLTALKNRSVIVPNIVNNINIANVECVDMQKLPIQWPDNYE